MDVTITIYADGIHKKIIEVDRTATYEAILEKLGLNPETVMVFQGDMPQPFDKSVSSEGEIKILRIVSGG